MPEKHPRISPGLLHIEAGNIGSEKVSILLPVFDFSRPTVISGPSVCERLIIVATRSPIYKGLYSHTALIPGVWPIRHRAKPALRGLSYLAT